MTYICDRCGKEIPMYYAEHKCKPKPATEAEFDMICKLFNLNTSEEEKAQAIKRVMAERMKKLEDNAI